MNNNYYQSFCEEVNSAERARRTQRNVSAHSGRCDVDANVQRSMYDAIHPYDYFRAARERLECIGRHMKVKRSSGLRN